MVKPTLSKQDVRETILNLSQYDSNEMINDLGNHRHTELPLSGKPVNLAPPPPPNAKKFGVATARLAEHNDAIASAWGALYDPSLDEERDDGLGTGQAHRSGENFRPDINFLSGRGGKSRRSRSHSPRGRAGRKRGLVEPGNLASKMRVARQPRTSVPNFNPTKFDPKMTVVKPRVSTRALDDMAAAQKNAFGAWKSNDAAPRRPRAPIKADAEDKDIGHWWGGRLAINQDKMDYFSGNRALQKAITAESAVTAESRGRPVHSDASVRMAHSSMNVSKLQGLDASIHASLSHAKSNASFKPHQSSSLGASKYAPGADDYGVHAQPPVSKTESHVNPLNSTSHINASPLLSPRRGRFSEDPTTEQEFQAMVQEYQERVGSARVLLNVHIEELSKASDEVAVLTEKLSKAIKVQEAKEEDVQRTRNYMAQNEVMLNQLRQHQSKFIADLARVRAETEENLRQEQEKKNAEAHKLQDEFIKAQLLRSEIFKAQLAQEQAEKMEAQRLEKERLEKERLEKERIEKEAVKECQYQQQKAQQLEERRSFDDIAKQMSDYAELTTKKQDQNGPNQGGQSWQDSTKLYELEKKNRAEVERMEKELAESMRTALDSSENQKQEKASAALRQIERIKRLHNTKADSILDGLGGLEASRHAPQELIRPKSPVPQSVTLPFSLPTSKYASSTGSSHISRPHTPLLSVQDTTPERAPVTIKPAIVFNKDRNPTLHTLAFAAANPILGIPPMTGYPYQARIIIRPIFDVDAIVVTLSSTDQPGGKIKRTLNGLIGEEDTQYLFGLSSVKEYILALTNIFYGRAPAVFNAQF